MRKINILFLLLVSLYLQSCQLEELEPYKRKVNSQRFTKDSLFKLSIESPIDEKQKVQFLHLDYFAPDESYKIIGEIEVYPKIDTVYLENTQGDNTRLMKFGMVRGSFNRRMFSIEVYAQTGFDDSKGEVNLLFPFMDETTGISTYEGGRYLDIKYIKGNPKVLLDFNLCYNPFSHYSDKFSSTIAPPQNKIEYKVEAGEKNYSPYFQF